MKKRKRKPSGTKRMREFGYKRVEVWLDANEAAIVEKAADLVERKLATFIREAAVGSAAVVIQGSTGNRAWDRDQWGRMIDDKRSPVAEGAREVGREGGV